VLLKVIGVQIEQRDTLARACQAVGQRHADHAATDDEGVEGGQWKLKRWVGKVYGGMLVQMRDR
jgi:hypothetical protein